MADLLAMLILAAACWGLRIVFVTVLPADRLPARATRALQFLAPAVLAALAASELAGTATSGDARGAVAAVGIVAVVGLVAYRFRNLTATVAVALLLIALTDLVLL